MKKLSKEQYERLQSLIKALDDTQSDLDSTIDDFNQEMKLKYQGEIEPAQRNFNEARERLQGFVEELKDEATEYYDSQSENWQASDEGNDYSEWIDEMDFAYNDLDNEFEADSFSEIESPDFDFSSVENIEEEP